MFGFLLFATVGAFLPFVFLYFHKLGFSNAEIGIFAAVGPGVMILAQPFWGWLSDYSNRPEKILVILSLGCAATVGLLLTGKSFVMIVIYLVLYNFFYSSITPIYDSIVIETLINSEISYGQIRWLGSLGYAVTAYLVGRVIEITDVSISLKIYIGIALLMALVASRLSSVSVRTEWEKPNLWPLFKNREFVIFLIAASLVIGSNAINYTFLAFLFKELGGGEGFVGLAMLIGAFAEIPFFIFSAKLLQRFKMTSLLLVAFVITAFRWFICSKAVSPYQLLAYQMLNCITFGLLYSTAVTYVDRLTPKKLRASGQNLFWAATFGLGSILGNLLGGWIYQYNPVQTLFNIAGWAATSGAIIFMIGIVIPKRFSVK